ncbi:MAG: hypothetical protein ACRD2W_24900, partial [Acidimicrobiales bacterium]
MAASPLAGRSNAAMAWTGKEMVVWGGVACKQVPCSGDAAVPLGDGAAYDPAADRWRPLATSPLAARSGTADGWTGREVLLWGGDDGTAGFTDGAAYDP